MPDVSLETLIAHARRHTMTSRERREQGLSFVVGSGAAEGVQLHRGTVSIAIPATVAHLSATVSAADGPKLDVVPFDVDGVLRQFALVRALVEQRLAGQTVEITPELIMSLHAVVGEKAGPVEFGVFRTHDVEVRGSLHRPLAPNDVPGAVTDLCKHLNARWNHDDAVSLSAFALWAVNWIHPFADGNGRVARALSYLILNLKLGLWLPGSPTLVEQLNERRAEYFDALAAADLDVRNGATPDLKDLRDLLRDLLVRQLRSMPALSERAEAQFSEIFAQRIGHLSLDARRQIFGSQELSLRAWSIGDYLVVHVAAPEALAAAERLFDDAGCPFPGLIASPGERSIIKIHASQRGAIVRPQVFEVEDGGALWLDPNAAIIVERPSVAFRGESRVKLGWKLDGVLYVLRQGDEITSLWVLDMLDLLVGRHVQEAG